MDAKTVALFALLRGTPMVLGLAFLAIMLLRSARVPEPDDDPEGDSNDDGGQTPWSPQRTPSPRGGGRLPLRDTQPSRVRQRVPLHQGDRWTHPSRHRLPARKTHASARTAR